MPAHAMVFRNVHTAAPTHPNQTAPQRWSPVGKEEKKSMKRNVCLKQWLIRYSRRPRRRLGLPFFMGIVYVTSQGRIGV